MSPRIRNNLSIALMVALIAGLVGHFYGLLLSFIIEFEWALPHALRAMTVGFFCGLTAVLINQFLFRWHWAGWLRARPFWLASLVKIAILWVVFGSVIRLTHRVFNLMVAEEFQTSLDLLSIWRDDLAALLITSVFIFVVDMRALVGPGTFRRLATGYYHSPREEMRIFMFADVAQSTQIAAEIGDRAFHSYLSDLCNEIDLIVTEQGGEVVNYIGDAVLASWELKRRDAGLRAIVAGCRLFERIEQLQETFTARYGVGAKIRIVMHYGPVVIGETGINKRQVTMLGDTINVTARLEAAAKQTGNDFVVSQALITAAGDLPDQRIAAIGEHRLKGVAAPMQLCSIELKGT